MARTKAQIQEELRERGIAYDDEATVAQLEKLLAAAPASAESPDVATGPQHPASIVEPLPDDEKPGPGTVASREITPAEQDLPPGTSALQAPPDE